jgi:hypothetical protein
MSVAIDRRVLQLTAPLGEAPLYALANDGLWAMRVHPKGESAVNSRELVTRIGRVDDDSAVTARTVAWPLTSTAVRMSRMADLP